MANTTLNEYHFRNFLKLKRHQGLIKFHPILLFVFIISLFSSDISFAKDVAIPLKLEHKFIERVLIDQLFKSKKQSFRVNDDGTGCNFLELSHPKVDTHDALLRVKVDTWARIGQKVGDSCFLLVDWKGKTDFYNEVKLINNGRGLSITVVNSKLYKMNGEEDQASTQLFQWFNEKVYPVMNEIIIDLNEPVDNIKAFIPSFIGKSDEKSLKNLVNSFAISSVTLNPKGILLNLQFTIPDTTAAPAKSVAALTPEELSLLEKKLDALDAFITFTIRQFLAPDTPEAVRVELLETIIGLRYEVVDLLAHSENAGTDPVKQLFISTWQQIAPLIREIAKSQNDQAMAIHYLTFIAANDVLFTIEQIGPGLGLDVSIDGLRRLARLLNANPAIDPVEIIEDEIPELHLSKKSLAKPRSNADQWLNFIFPSANAANKPDKAVIERLNSWVPKKKDMNEYLPMVQQVIAYVTDEQLKESDLDSKFHKIYRSVVYAAAWQESCWRQYEAVKGQRWPVKSYSGDLGMMQINPRVWRGFYSVHKIKWDIVYNANAGAEILMHYLQRYALRNNEHKQTGKLENLARSTYAGYNGGPKQYARYRDKSSPKLLKRIDKAFYDKFLAVYNGDALAVKSCYPGI